MIKLYSSFYFQPKIDINLFLLPKVECPKISLSHVHTTLSGPRFIWPTKWLRSVRIINTNNRCISTIFFSLPTENNGYFDWLGTVRKHLFVGKQDLVVFCCHDENKPRRLSNLEDNAEYLMDLSKTDIREEWRIIRFVKQEAERTNVV